MLYHITLNESQRSLLQPVFPPVSAKLRKHDPSGVPEAILFMDYTGCRWSRLPMGYPPHKTVHYHYRSRSARGYLERTLRIPVIMKRHESNQPLSLYLFVNWGEYPILLSHYEKNSPPYIPQDNSLLIFDPNGISIV